MLKKMLSMIILLAFSLVVVGLSFAEEQPQAQDEKNRMIMPKKVSVDANFDGKIDRVEYYDSEGKIVKTEADINSDGKIDEWTEYENGKPVKTERDTNKDEKPDVFIEY